MIFTSALERRPMDITAVQAIMGSLNAATGITKAPFDLMKTVHVMRHRSKGR